MNSKQANQAAAPQKYIAEIGPESKKTATSPSPAWLLLFLGSPLACCSHHHPVAGGKHRSAGSLPLCLSLLPATANNMNANEALMEQLPEQQPPAQTVCTTIYSTSAATNADNSSSEPVKNSTFANKLDKLQPFSSIRETMDWLIGLSNSIAPGFGLDYPLVQLDWVRRGGGHQPVLQDTLIGSGRCVDVRVYPFFSLTLQF
uniref:Uncharacterized protein n=1 Tax=Ditylenchus dipsaci TaxID=166011 RepID=A0A915EC41_9BILA